jgi:hypothetical protein
MYAVQGGALVLVALALYVLLRRMDAAQSA